MSRTALRYRRTQLAQNYREGKWKESSLRLDSSHLKIAKYTHTHTLTPMVGRLSTEATSKKCSIRLVAALKRQDTICDIENRNRDRSTERDGDRNTVSHQIH